MNTRRAARLLSAAVLCTAFALAAQGTVKIVGDPTPDYIQITNAIFNAGAGAVIRASTGTYVEVFDIFSRTNLTIDGQYDMACVAKVVGTTVLQLPPTKYVPVVWVDDSSVQFIDLDIRGGRPASAAFTRGGGVYLTEKSTARMDGCRVYDNVANGFGGGIYVTNSSLTLTNSLVFSNRALNVTLGPYQPEGCGGGVAANYGYLEVYGGSAGGAENSIKWNYADHMGGGIYAADSSWCIVSNETSDVLQNIASNGAGIAVDGESVLQVHSGADVCGNRAVMAGGGILLAGKSTGLVRGANTFIGYNSAVLGPNTVSDAAMARGAGIAVQSASLEIRSSACVAHNQSRVAGGGLYLTNAACTVDGAYIGYPYNAVHTNEAGMGGGVLLSHDSMLMLTNDALVKGCIASAGGGGIYASAGAVVRIYDSTVKSNMALAGGGGGVYLADSSIMGRDAIIQDNTARAGDGGGIRAFFSQGYLDGASITTNRADRCGGGISWKGGAGYTLLITNPWFRANRAGLDGGGLALAAPAELVDGSISMNVASNHGGALFLSNTVALLDGIYLENNQADWGGAGAGCGGAIFAGYGAGVDLRSQPRGLLLNNNSGIDGGGLFATAASTVTVFKGASMARFLSNSARSDGGGIGLYESRLTVTGAVEVRGNTALEKGGGLYAQRSAAHLSGGVWFGNADTNWANRAGSYGGGLACNNATVSLANVSFVNNVATQYSGGLDASDCVVSGTNVLFQGNQCLVYDGGGTYLEYGNATLRDLTFTSNSAARYGGGLCLYEGVARLTSCHVQDGRAAAGGGIAVDGGVAYVSAATVEVNRATDGGGGILVFSSGVLRGTNLVVRGNDGDSDRDTSGQGGGLLVSGESSVYLYGTNGMSVISSNAGYFGGGAFVSNGLLYVSGKAWIEGNTATNGGGLYVAAGTAEVYNAYVLRNAAAAHGGGAFVCTNSFVGMLNCLVAENRMSPAGWGGGIRNWYGDLDLIGCTIVSNTVGGVECSVGGSILDMDGCIVYGHALVSVTPGFSVEYSDIEGGYPGTGNYDAQPLLNNDNYHLTAWSPCRDQGWLVMGDRDVDNEARSGNFDTGFDEYIDGDNDNLPDVVETDTGAWADDADMGTDPADDDSDDDGVKDGDEWLADTDPNKAGSFLRITNIYKTGAVWVRWVGGTNATRWFEVAEDFHETNSPDWQIISTEPAPTSGEGFGPDGFTTNCAVYRIRATRFP